MFDLRRLTGNLRGALSAKNTEDLALEDLIKALQDKRPEIRWDATVQLGKMGDCPAAAVDALAQAMHDKDGLVRRAAKEAIDKINTGSRESRCVAEVSNKASSFRNPVRFLMLACCCFLVLPGLAMLTTGVLAPAGWYCVAAGLLVPAFKNPIWYLTLAWCGFFVLAGLAMLMTRDLASAGWYCIAAGLLVSALALFLRSRLGYDAPLQLSPLVGPASLPAPSPSRHRCPACGSSDLHILSMGETRRFYGYERFVLYLPRRCLACGHAFEAHPGTAGCYFLACFSVLGLLFGFWLISRPLSIIYFELKLDPVDWILGMIVAPVLGPLTVWRFSKETRRYWRQRLAQEFTSPNRVKPETQN